MVLVNPHTGACLSAACAVSVIAW